MTTSDTSKWQAAGLYKELTIRVTVHENCILSHGDADSTTSTLQGLLVELCIPLICFISSAGSTAAQARPMATEAGLVKGRTPGHNRRAQLKEALISGGIP